MRERGWTIRDDMSVQHGGGWAELQVVCAFERIDGRECARSPTMHLLRYFAALRLPKLVLWCYLLWWFHAVAHHFDPSPAVWATSVGLSGIIGLALVLSVGESKLGGWPLFRLFLMPFCVSSFAALVKGQGFWLVFPPTWQENLSAFGVLVVFLGAVRLLKRLFSSTCAGR